MGCSRTCQLDYLLLGCCSENVQLQQKADQKQISTAAPHSRSVDRAHRPQQHATIVAGSSTRHNSTHTSTARSRYLRMCLSPRKLKPAPDTAAARLHCSRACSHTQHAITLSTQQHSALSTQPHSSHSTQQHTATLITPSHSARSLTDSVKLNLRIVSSDPARLSPYAC